MPWKKLYSLKDKAFSKEWVRLNKQVKESKVRIDLVARIQIKIIESCVRDLQNWEKAEPD